MSELAVPDPRHSTVPSGWAIEFAAPAILGTEDWNFLDEAEGRLKAVASYIEAFGGDRLEFEKAMRIVEKRRGDLLGVDVGPGSRTDLTMQRKVDEHHDARHRWRTIARNWDKLWPIIVEARKVSEVTQAALLRACRRAAALLPSPPGKFHVLYADPPWPYSREQHTRDAGSGGAESHYATMDLADICAYQFLEQPLSAILEDDAVLFLWATSPLLPEALEVVDAWDFVYKASFVWDKVKHNVGNYNSVRHELLLVATRGSYLPETKTLIDSVQVIPKSDHSAKPDYFYEIIETLYPSASKIELFARNKREGWTYSGCEVFDAA